jgi:hypothetical protein
MKSKSIVILLIFISNISFSQENQNKSNILPTSEVPGCFLISSNEGNKLYLGKENIIRAVAHGYYNTELSVDNGTITRNPENSLSYTLIPNHLGECKITIYGVSEKGDKVALGMYFYKIVKTKK